MTVQAKDTKKALGIFFGLLMVISSFFYYLDITYPQGPNTRGLMWGVGLSAILTCLIMKRDLKTLGWGWGKWKYQWMSFLIPLAYIMIAYAIIWGADFGGFYNTEFVQRVRDNYGLGEMGDAGVIVYFLGFTAIFGLAGSLSTALGEEIGWRGFLAPELAKVMPFTGVVLVSGFIWSFWHYPLIIGSNYNNEGVSLGYQLFFFTTFVLSATSIMTYLRLKSGSLWTGAIFHASHNLFIQAIFTPLTIQYANTGKYIDEFGAVPPLVALVFAIYFWTKGRKEFT